MFDYGNPTPAQVSKAMSTLRDLGVATVHLDFSGGNDEGGVDYARYLDSEGNEVDGIPEANAYRNRYYQNGREHDEGWIVWTGGGQKRPATADEIRISELREILEAPIYARYYTFAGEFYVDGTLTWDVAAGTHKMSGQESHQVWEDIS